MEKSFSWQYLPYIFLAVYVIFVCYSFYNLNARLDFIWDHPGQVVSDARSIRSRIDELQNFLPGLLANPELGSEQKLSVLERQEKRQDKNFRSIAGKFASDRDYVDLLGGAFKKLREKYRTVIKSMSANEDYSQAVKVYKKELSPEVERVLYFLDEIIENAQFQAEEERESVRRSMLISIVITVIFGLAVSILFYAAMTQIHRKNRQLEDRERLFDQLSKNVDEIFIISGDDKKFSYATSNSQRLIGIEAEKILEDSENLLNFLSDADADWLNERMSSWDDKKSAERTVITDNGNRIFRIKVYPIEDNDKRRFIIAIEDKSEDYRRQQALSEALDNAQQATVAKSSFLAHMSHEIRTPMNAIIGMTTIALSRIDNQERVLDCLKKIAESSRHLLGLVNDVLDMSKIESGKLAINNEPFNLPECVHNVSNLVGPQAESRNLEFDVYLENVDEERLIGDPLRLNQILLNILSNALKFTPPGGRIEMKIQQIQKEGHKVSLRFVISDTGIGMSEEFIKRLASPFEQASSSTAAKYGGTGLGMSITYKMAALMGGSIDVESRVGAGTTFYVELPFAYESQTSGARREALPFLRVLVVDDDPGTCEHAALLLEQMGLSVRWRLSGKEAVELVKEARDSGVPYDVCFLDWKMPEMDGPETAARIRTEAGDELLIIIMSAYDWQPIEEKAKEAGVNDFVAKPFFASSLFNALVSTTRKISRKEIERDSAETAYDFSGKRILMAEDNEFNREIAREFLDMVNIEAEDAENGEEAVKKFAASPPGYYDLILMDIQMPKMDGYEAARAIRALDRPDAQKIHILATTANAFSEDVAQAVAAGMNGHISKPLDMGQLHRLIKTHLDMYSKEIE